MNFVPVVHCPNCKTPFTTQQLGVPFIVDKKYTVMCHICSTAFDFDIKNQAKKRTIWEFITRKPIEYNLIDVVTKRGD